MNQQDKELVLRIAEDLRIRHLIDDEPVYEFAHRYHLAKLAEATPPRHEILEAQAVALALAEAKVTDDLVLAALQSAKCFDRVRMSYDTGPYEVTRPTVDAVLFAKAIVSQLAAQYRAASHDKEVG